MPGVEVDELVSPLKRVHSLLVAGKLNEAEEILRPYLADTSGKTPAKKPLRPLKRLRKPPVRPQARPKRLQRKPR